MDYKLKPLSVVCSKVIHCKIQHIKTDINIKKKIRPFIQIIVSVYVIVKFVRISK